MALTNDPASLGTGILKSRDGMKRGDWVRLLDAVFDCLQGPVEWDVFVALLAALLGVVRPPGGRTPGHHGGSRPQSLRTGAHPAGSGDALARN